MLVKDILEYLKTNNDIFKELTLTQKSKIEGFCIQKIPKKIKHPDEITCNMINGLLDCYNSNLSFLKRYTYPILLRQAINDAWTVLLKRKRKSKKLASRK